MIIEITKDPNDLLHKKLAPIPEVTPEILSLIEDMKETMIEAKGVGIAGNQVGKDTQIFVIDQKLAEEHNVPEAFINPEITEYGRETDVMDEGCLSLPGYWKPIIRSKKIKIKFTAPDGSRQKIRARGFLARVLQHEFDHLQGYLIHDRFEGKMN